MSINGIMNIIKPAGESSFSIVSLVRRLSGARRVGHAGTLDKAATGVLPVCIGKATRVVEFLIDSHKIYRAEIKLGVVTDTYDTDGCVIEEKDCSSVERGQLGRLLTSFVGSIEQVPPIYSALKKNGTPLHRLARAGVDVELKPRVVHIYNIDLLKWEPPLFTIDIECGKGTYIRSLAYDIGQQLGCGAHLVNLIRIRNGAFHIEEGLTPQQLEAMFKEDCWQDAIYPMDAVLDYMPAAIVNANMEKAITNGTSVELFVEKCTDADWCRAYSEDGVLIALLRYDADVGKWHPRKVLV